MDLQKSTNEASLIPDNEIKMYNNEKKVELLEL